MGKSPLQKVKEQFGDKASLVKQLETMFGKEDLFLDRINGDKGLKSVSNAHLLKLYETAAKVKEQFGSRKALINGILEKAKRTKDEGFKIRLETYPLPRLLDCYRTYAKKS